MWKERSLETCGQIGKGLMCLAEEFEFYPVAIGKEWALFSMQVTRNSLWLGLENFCSGCFVVERVQNESQSLGQGR